jgi:hypothetical protein
MLCSKFDSTQFTACFMLNYFFFFNTIKRVLSDSLCCWIHKIFVVFVESSKTISCLIGIYYMCKLWYMKLWSFLGLQASLEVGHVLIFIVTTNHNGGPNLKLSAGMFSPHCISETLILPSLRTDDCLSITHHPFMKVFLLLHTFWVKICWLFIQKSLFMNVGRLL